MMLNRTPASQDQIDKICHKHLKRVYGLKYSYDGEDDIGFVWCCTNPFISDHYNAVKMGVGILQWQVRNGEPMFFSFQKGSASYDVSYPNGKLYERLKKLSNKAKNNFWKGNQI